LAGWRPSCWATAPTDSASDRPGGGRHGALDQGGTASLRLARLAAGDLGAIEQLLLRVARLADDFPEVAECELDPILAAPEGVTVLGATVRLARPATLLDRGVRRLPG
jgi:hypothetical protein